MINQIEQYLVKKKKNITAYQIFKKTYKYVQTSDISICLLKLVYEIKQPMQ